MMSMRPIDIGRTSVYGHYNIVAASLRHHVPAGSFLSLDIALLFFFFGA